MDKRWQLGTIGFNSGKIVISEALFEIAVVRLRPKTFGLVAGCVKSTVKRRLDQ
jgi:hypothetical protein